MLLERLIAGVKFFRTYRFAPPSHLHGRNCGLAINQCVLFVNVA